MNDRTNSMDYCPMILYLMGEQDYLRMQNNVSTLYRILILLTDTFVFAQQTTKLHMK